MLRAEGHRKALVHKVAGIAFKHGSGVAGGDEFAGAYPAAAEDVGAFLEVLLEVRELSLGVVGQEGIGRDASGGLDDPLYVLHREECLGIFGNEGGTTCLQELAADFILNRGKVLKGG